MELPNGTYTDMVLDMVDEFKHLKVKYPILAQLSKPNLKSGQSVLTLNDLKDLKDPQLAEIYYQNIKDLADETVHKVSDMQDNARISKLFRLFPVMMIYQHGLGYSKYGFNDVLPYEDYIGVMQTASDIFMNNEMSSATLETVYDRLVNSRGLFPDYVTAPGLYRSGMPRQADEIITTDVNDERVQEMLSRVIGSDTEETPAQPTEVKIEATDKVIWGHPTIGKSFLKKNQDNRFISLDDDYTAEINTKVKEIADKYNVTTYQVKDGGNQQWNTEYNEMMQNLFDKAKAIALSENKILFTSNTNLLKNNAAAFDKVINLTNKEFQKRISERGAKYDTVEWKKQIEDVISNIPSDKVILTDKYLSDLLPSEPEAPEMKRDTPIQPEVSDMIQPEGLPAIPRTSSSCK
jgi:hypothetical protein